MEKSIQEFKKKINEVQFWERPAIFHEIAKTDEFKTWLEREIVEGSTHDDEYYLYHIKDEYDEFYGSRISSFGNENLIRRLDGEFDSFPCYAKPLEVGGKEYWVMTIFGQGAMSWIETNESFQKKYVRKS